jgi:FAD/FMN-containing dehydrogenase
VVGASNYQAVMIDPALLSNLAALLGPKGYTDDAETMAPWLSDWRGRVHGMAPAMLSPASTAEVQEVVRLCAAAGAKLTMQGGNSGQCAGATPPADGSALLLSLRRMNRIRFVDADAMLLSGDAGVILVHAHEAAEAVGLRFPLTLGGKGSATLGGLVSTNAGGTQVLRHGTMRALTAGIEVVLADGSLLDLMVPLAKDNQGPDPKHLFIGAEGTLGIVTGVTLRLVPAVAARAVGWLAVASPTAALATLRAMEPMLGASLEGFELIPTAALDAVLEHVPGTRAPLSAASAWHVLVEVVAATGGAEPAARLEAALADALAAGLIGDAVIAASEAQAEAFWKLRDSISEAERAKGPALQHDISVPVAAMPAYIETAPGRIAAAFPGATSLAFGHLGDGNVHFHVRPPLGGDAEQWIATHGEAASRAVYDAAVAAGGSISAEHGIGRTKPMLLADIGDPARLAVLTAMKAAMDPAGLFNPGVLLPPPFPARLAPGAAIQ